MQIANSMHCAYNQKLQFEHNNFSKKYGTFVNDKNLLINKN